MTIPGMPTGVTSLHPQLTPEALGFLTRLAAAARGDQSARSPARTWAEVYDCRRCPCGGVDRQVCMRCGTAL